jgi:hypothetical protein
MSLPDDLERALGPIKTVEELTAMGVFGTGPHTVEEMEAAGVFGPVKSVQELTADRKTVEELTAMGVFG